MPPTFERKLALCWINGLMKTPARCSRAGCWNNASVLPSGPQAICLPLAARTAHIPCPIISSRIRASRRRLPAEFPDTSARFCSRSHRVSRKSSLQASATPSRRAALESCTETCLQENPHASLADPRAKLRRSKPFPPHRQRPKPPSSTSKSQRLIHPPKRIPANSDLRNGSFISVIRPRLRRTATRKHACRRINLRVGIRRTKCERSIFYGDFISVPS